jgi:hypothetical protein
MDNNEIIRLLKDDTSILPAVKYVKDQTGWFLKDCKEYVERIRDQEMHSIGTIYWFRCEDQLPPRLENNAFTYSATVLVTDGTFVKEACYCHSPAQGGPYWHINGDYKITHWSYINYPDK